MCYSAGASFAAAVVISTAGIVAVKSAHKPSQIGFAVIPLIFGIQQFAEGCLWLTLQSSDYETVKSICNYVFLITAQVIWPVMLPLSVLLMEEDNRRKKILRTLLATGMALSLYYGFYLLVSRVTSEILDCHILYSIDRAKIWSLPVFFIYLAVTVAPFFISGARRMYIMGILIILSLAVSVFFYKVHLTSVWCFFAALISIIIVWIIKSNKAEAEKVQEM
jgi:hypothetical protein